MFVVPARLLVQQLIIRHMHRVTIARNVNWFKRMVWMPKPALATVCSQSALRGQEQMKLVQSMLSLHGGLCQYYMLPKWL